MASREKKSVAIIGAGLSGLVTAKVLLHESGNSFEFVTILEKGPSLGGVWSTERTYPGLGTNSPALTYEIPGFNYPERLRKVGQHVPAGDVNDYFEAFAAEYDLKRHISFNSLVEEVTWDTARRDWVLRIRQRDKVSLERFKYLVVCNGMYHTKNLPPVCDELSAAGIDVYHSSDVGKPSVRERLSKSKYTLVVGAGKSALDLATLLAKREWNAGDAIPPKSESKVMLLYRRPHWLSPKAIVRNSVYFERLLFSRFVNAWLPFAEHPDAVHRWIAESRIGRLLTRAIFAFVADDFNKSARLQDLPHLVPQHPMKEALSGALHMVPDGYLDLVRSGRIQITEGSIASGDRSGVTLQTATRVKQLLEVESVVWATGYRLSFPFFSINMLRQLGVFSETQTLQDNSDLGCLKMHRMIAPTATINPKNDSDPHRNIAFNGFAYSLLNPAVAHVSAHWIADYFMGRLEMQEDHILQEDIDKFYTWQCHTFAAHGAKGVHIGSHATLYNDLLLSDMRLRTGHVEGWRYNPLRLVREWLRPMYPGIYADLYPDKQRRDEIAHAGLR